MSESVGAVFHQGVSSPWKIETHKLLAPKRFDVEPADIHKETVVVTGGAGFLGQHIVKHLLEQKEFPIREVRVFDVQPFEWCSGLEVTDTHVPLRQFQGDICNQTLLEKAFAGATAVIHNTGVIDNSSIPDKARMNQINVQGTEVVIESCINTNVSYLIYTSSTNAAERIGAYGVSKRQAEDLILQANHRRVKNGDKLRTCALRPVALYGEGDPKFISNSLRILIRNNTFYRLGGDASRFQCAYAGNVAWAFVTALSRFRSKPRGRDLAGCYFFVADDTPIMSHSGFVTPFALHVGAKISKLYIPCWILYMAARVCELISYILSPFYTLRFPISKAAVFAMFDAPIRTYKRAEEYLGYKPRYTYEDILPRILQHHRQKYNEMIKRNNITI